jgi:flagellar hook-associated protein 1
MPGLNSSLNIGLSGLQATQGALSVVGHNIANVNTPNYSRQTVDLTANRPQTFGSVAFGTGVSLANITGVRDKFLEMQITQSTSRQQGANVRYSGVEGIASVFQDDGTSGLSSLVQNYFEGFQQLSARPEDGALRTNVIGQAQSLVNGLKSRYQMLEDQRTQADQNIESLSNEVNTLTAQIADLNARISAESTPGSDSDGRDSRQALVNKLASLVGIQVYEDSSKRLQISLDSGAAPLVSGNTAYTMSTPKAGTFRQVQIDVGGASIDVTNAVKEGTLGANLDLRDNILMGYEAKLDELAAGIAGQTNLQHRAGYALDGTTTGVDFFSGSVANGADGLPTTVTAASNYRGMVNLLSVNAAVAASPSLIAAAQANAVATIPPASAGNNANALALAKLQNLTTSVDTNGDGVGDTGPFSTVVSGLVNTIGTDDQKFKTTSDGQDNLLSALKTQRDRVSAVDMDEEATSLIAYQRSYQASAHFISVIDQLTAQLLTQFGA